MSKPKISMVNGQNNSKELHGQSFDLAVTAVTIESMGETPLCHLVEVSVEGEREGEWD